MHMHALYVRVRAAEGQSVVDQVIKDTVGTKHIKLVRPEHFDIVCKALEQQAAILTAPGADIRAERPSIMSVP